MLIRKPKRPFDLRDISILEWMRARMMAGAHDVATALRDAYRKRVEYMRMDLMELEANK